MKKLKLWLGIAMLTVLAFYPQELTAQCTEACAIFNDEETGEEIGWACVDFGDETGQTDCRAWSKEGKGGCDSDDCEGEPTVALAVDDDGVGFPALVRCARDYDFVHWPVAAYAALHSS